MFDASLTGADNSAVVAAIAESARAEAAAAARRLAAIAELVTRHADGPTDCAQPVPTPTRGRPPWSST